MNDTRFSVWLKDALNSICLNSLFSLLPFASDIHKMNECPWKTITCYQATKARIQGICDKKGPHPHTHRIQPPVITGNYTVQFCSTD